jgi:HEPN domain-containing protein
MKPHEEWIFKARHDLDSAVLLMNAANPLLDVAIYHTQQCAEKALKAYLSFRGEECEKTHNLVLLNDHCSRFDNGFMAYQEDSLFLSPYSTLYRYPEGDLLPSIDEVKKAIEAALRILRFSEERVAGK